MSIAIKKSNGTTLIEVDCNEGSMRKVELMGEDSVTLKFSLATCVTIPIGCYANLTAYGLRIFYVTEEYKPTFNASTGGYDYELKLDNYYIKWKNKIFKYQPQFTGQESSWTLTEKVSKFGLIIESNLQALGYTYIGSQFVVEVDSDVDDEVITCTFSSTSILAALTVIAQAAKGGKGCDWWIDGNVIHFGTIENHRNSGKSYNLGSNVNSISISDSQNTSPTRVYAYGSDRNITKRYRKELRLYPTETSPQGYIRDSYRKITYDMFTLNESDYVLQVVPNSTGNRYEMFNEEAVGEPKQKVTFESIPQKLSDGLAQADRVKFQIYRNYVSGVFGSLMVYTNSSYVVAEGLVKIYYKKDGVDTLAGTIRLYNSTEGEYNSAYGRYQCAMKSRDGEVYLDIPANCEIYYTVCYEIRTNTWSITKYSVSFGSIALCNMVVKKLLTLSCYAADGTFISTIGARLNPSGAPLSDDESTWIEATLPNNTSYFKANGIKNSMAKAAWFTSKTNGETAVNAVVTNRLMLPDTEYYVLLSKYNSVMGSYYTGSYELADLVSEKECIERGYSSSIVNGNKRYSDGNGNILVQIYNGNGYVDSDANLSVDEIVEETNIYDDIYPSFSARVLKAELVKSVEEKVDGELTGQMLDVWHIQTNITNFSNKYRIDSSKEFSVTFASGLLNGMTFEVKFLESKTKQDVNGYCWFEIFRNENYAVVLPNDILKPQGDEQGGQNYVGDSFNLFNYDTSYFDDALCEEAEKRLLLEVLNHFCEIRYSGKTYTMKVSSDWVYNDGDIRTFVLGERAYIQDYTRLLTRVIGYEYSLDFSYDNVTVTVGLTGTYSRREDLQKQIDALAFKGTVYQTSNANQNGNFLSKDKDDSTAFSLAMKSLETQGDAKIGGDANVSKDANIEGNETVKGTVNVHDSLTMGDPTDNEKSFVEKLRGFGVYWNGSGFCIDTDYLVVHKKAFFAEIEVQKVSHIGGQQILTVCGCKIDHVKRLTKTSNTFTLFFKKEDANGNTITNDWVKGDLVYCQSFNIGAGTSQNVGNKYYWVKVSSLPSISSTSMVDDNGETFNPQEYHCIRVAFTSGNYDTPANNSTTPCIDTSMTGYDAPSSGDNIVLLGHVKQSNETEADAAARQGATLLAGAGNWGQALIMWRGIGANASRPFIMPEPSVVVSPQMVKIMADEIALRSSGVLRLSSDQLICANNDGDKTMWLDHYGNVNIAGVLNRAYISIDNDLAKFRQYFTIVEDGSQEYDDALRAISYATQWGLQITNSLVYIPDMLRLDGVIDLGKTPAIDEEDGIVMSAQHPFSMVFPFAIPVDYTATNLEGGDDLIRPREWYDVCRTLTSNGDTPHLITWRELNSIVGRKITFQFRDCHCEVSYPLFTVERIYGGNGNEAKELYHFEGYQRREYGGNGEWGSTITVEMVLGSVQFSYEDENGNEDFAIRVGIFPIVTEDASSVTPNGTTEWGSE